LLKSAGSAYQFDFEQWLLEENRAGLIERYCRGDACPVEMA
jgi:hypothetical protein